MEPCRCVYPDKCFCTPEQKKAGASAPVTKLFVSHSARDWEGNVKWFVVEPQSDPSDQVASLRAFGRTVIEINVPDSRVGRDEMLWGEDAPAVRVISDALFGQHPERGGQEREQAAFAVAQALKAAGYQLGKA